MPIRNKQPPATSAYLLQHVAREDTDDEDVKALGIYSSPSKARAATKRFVKLPGFRRYPDAFHIDRYTLDRDEWTEGFVTYRWKPKLAPWNPLKDSASLKPVLRELRRQKPDYVRALKMLRQASSEGDAAASYALATWYLHGTHVRKDVTKAVGLLERAAAENIPEASFDLAVSYEMGIGTRKNARKAYAHYLRGALWGDQQSYCEVGRCLYYGIGIKRDKATACFWLARAKAFGKS